MKKNFHVKRGDLVEVISGNHKGTLAKCFRSSPPRSRCSSKECA